MDEQELIENPEALLMLMRQAVEHLIEQRPDTVAQEAQLRAVAKAIEQLEKQQIAVPDSLRQTKMTLVAEIGQQDQFNRQLMVLGEGLTEVLETIESTIDKPRSEGKSHKESTPRQRRSRSSDQLVTPKSILRKFILQALTELGGSARGFDVLERMEDILKDKLLPGDMERHKDGELIWRNNVRWERYFMVKDGILLKDSKRGHWELAENQP